MNRDGNLSKKRFKQNRKENTLLTKKVGRKLKTQIKIRHFFRYIQFGQIDKKFFGSWVSRCLCVWSRACFLSLFLTFLFSLINYTPGVSYFMCNKATVNTADLAMIMIHTVYWVMFLYGQEIKTLPSGCADDFISTKLLQ